MSDPFGSSYYAPQFKVKIEGEDLSAEALGSITSITVTKKMGQADHFSFEVQDELKDGEFKWLGTKSFKYGNKVNISMGYVDNTTLTLTAHIDSIVPKFNSGVMPTFTVEGKDKGYVILAEKSDYKVYNQKKDSDIVSSIATEVGLSATVDDTGGTPPEKKEKKGGISNLQFIQKMVEDNKGYEFFVSDGTLYFRKSKTKDEPAITLEWGKHLISFDPKMDFSAIVTEVTVKWWDEKEQKAIEGKAVSSDEVAIGAGKTAAKAAKDIFGDQVKIITDQKVESNDAAKSLAQSILQKQNKNFITGQGKTPGIPDLVPGIMIKVDKLGTWFSGKYYVESTTHTIDTGSGYQTTFNVRRNTVGE
jgi:phage protein D